MANHASHAALGFAVKHTRYTVTMTYLASTGIPTDPTSPDTQFSLDNSAWAPCAEETTLATGTPEGAGIITLSGAETNGSTLVLWGGGTGIVAPLITVPIVQTVALHTSLTATGASTSTTITTTGNTVLMLARFYRGAIIKTTGGTGGGGTGGANNQARRVTDYSFVTSTGVRTLTVSPAWETTPDATTTFEIHLAPEMYGKAGDVLSLSSNGSPWEPNSVAAGTLTKSAFTTNLDTSALALNQLVGRTITFLSGNNIYVARVITGSTVSATATLKVRDLPADPVAGDGFLIS